MSSDTLLFDLTDNVAVITLNRPAVRNALRWIIGQTEDAREGPRAFAERRDPRYQGR